MDYDLKIIKKKYGEDMAKLCREFFPTLLEKEGLLSTSISMNFEPNHSLYQDLIDQGKEFEFKDFIYGLLDMDDDTEITSQKSPKELLSEAGYDLYECKSEKEIQKFRKYYAKGEELCTFNGGRLNSCRVFFAVKKDVDEIKRIDYPNPQRQDRYGTSVISIQFMKDYSHTLSIKNRYNHRVNNPDSTFSNNLDNIIKGLTKSFEDEYGLIQQYRMNYGFEINGYTTANDGKFHKYNNEINNIYYCPNNIILDNYEVKHYEKEKYIIMDYFIVDLVNKKIKVYDEKIKDPFLDTVDDIEKIQIERLGKNKKLVIKIKNKEDIKIVLNENNEMIRLENPNVEKIKDYFLRHNYSLQELDLPNLKIVGNEFLSKNRALKEINLPNLQEVGDEFLWLNKVIEKVNLPNLEKVGYNFLSSNEALQVLTLPKLENALDEFLFMNRHLKELNCPKLEKVEANFMHANKDLQKLNLLKLKEVDDNFLFSNNALQILNLPNLRIVGENFLHSNTTLVKLNCPNLEKIDDFFLNNNPIFNNYSIDINKASVALELIKQRK